MFTPTTETGNYGRERNLKPLRLKWLKALKPKPISMLFPACWRSLPSKQRSMRSWLTTPGMRKNAPKTGSNTRNGYSSKTVLCNNSEIELNTPRDRENTFEPELIKKHQTRITQMDSQILSLCAKGMTTREIVATFKEMYDSDVSPTLISKVTDAVKRAGHWVAKTDKWIRYIPLFIWTVCCQSSSEWQCDKQSSFPCAGDQYRRSESVAGMWLSGNEGTKFWLSVLAELRKRGPSGHPDCLCGRSEGLPGCDKQRLPEISANQQKLACALGKPQYALQLSAGYPQDHLPSTLQTQSNPWTAWSVPRLRNAKCSRRMTRYERLFIWQSRMHQKKWGMPIQNWRLAMGRFIIEFGDRLSDHL